jgi:hypothetical protein
MSLSMKQVSFAPASRMIGKPDTVGALKVRD